MNTFILSSLLCLVCSVLGVLGSAVTFSSGLSRVPGVTYSGEGLQSSLGEDEELELDEDLSGGEVPDNSHHVLRLSKEERGRKKKGKGKRKNKNKSKSTTAFMPEHTYQTGGHTSGLTAGDTPLTSADVTEDPCTTSHQGYCIHGHCKYMEDLREPVCVCLKGFDGERCGIQLLETRNEEEERSSAEMVQTVLVVLAVVLSTISCSAILLMACAHYRTHKHFLAAYLGSNTEKEKLQKPASDIIV